MISSIPSYDEELLNSAYANIGLIADKGWAFYQDDPFRKLNHTLWVQNCKLTARYRENGNYQPRCVRDTIPESRLARYGNYEYSEERERMYKSGDNISPVQHPNLYSFAITEPWMLEEVEENFTRLSSEVLLPMNDELLTQQQNSFIEEGHLETPEKISDRGKQEIVQSKWSDILKKRDHTLESVVTAKNSKTTDSTACSFYKTNSDDPYNKNVDPEDYEKYLPPRYSIDNMAEMQLQIRVTSDTVRDLWNPFKSSQQYYHHQQQQQKHQQQRQQFQYSHGHQQNLPCGRQQQHLEQQHHLHSNQQQQYLQCGLQYQTLSMRPGRHSSCPESIRIIRRSPPPMLSAEVPEFFPNVPINRSKGHHEQSVPLQFFPSSAERSYQEELFPYNRGHVPCSGNIFQTASVPIQQVSSTSSINRTSHQWIQRPSPALHIQIPICPSPHQSACSTVQSVCPTIIHRQVQMQDKLVGNMTPQGGLASAPIPVYQRPLELYNDPSQRRKNQGVDFNNLILLTKSAMKARRNQSKNPQQSSSFILESRQPNLKSETDVLQWLEKGYPKRAKEFVAVNTLVSDFQNFELKCDNEKTVSSNQSTEDIINCETKNISLTTLEKSLQKSNDIYIGNNVPTKKRLYRDVLTNSSSSGIMFENVFDKRYDELERQAMEQYRTSEECLALRYQELERQAMEQYRNGDNSAGSLNNNLNQAPSSSTQGKERQKDQCKLVIEENDCTESPKCSGFGHCSPAKNYSSPSDKGTQPRQPITILRPESKLGIGITQREDFHNKYSRSAVVTKSLTTLNQRIFRDSKNTTRGASGDKIDRTVQASPKRRLILMSPSKRESEATLLSKTSDLGSTYTFQSMKRHASGSYQPPEVIQTGGGDEKITILRSSGTEGIRKLLFLANEELMDSSPESLGIRLLDSTEESGSAVKKMASIKTPKEQFLDVSSKTFVAPIINVAEKDEEQRSISFAHPFIWIPL